MFDDTGGYLKLLLTKTGTYQPLAIGYRSATSKGAVACRSSIRIKRHPRLKYFECMIRNAGAPEIQMIQIDGNHLVLFARKNHGKFELI
jgi:hypothetical protein